MNHSANMKISDGNYLRSSGRNLTVPFSVDIKSEGGTDELLCTGILRFLPGKRLVCSGKWNDLDVVVKLFLDKSGASRHFRREERGVVALGKSGVMTPRLLFSGTAVSGNIPVLGFEMIKKSEDLGKVWDNAQSDDLRLSLLNHLVSVLAKQHKAGLSQKDPHTRNFILSGGNIYAIDGDAVYVKHMGKPLSYKRSFKNLGLFFAQFYPVYSNLIHDAFKFYAREREWIPSETLYHSLMKEILQYKDRSEKKYLKKIFRESTDVVCRKSLDRFMVCRRSFYDNAMALFLDNPQILLKNARILKNGNSSTVFLIELSNRLIVVKRYNIKNFLHAIRRSYRKSRAFVSWRNAHLLKSIGINTPNPVAMMEKRFGPLRSVSYILTEYVDGTDIQHFLNSDKAEKIDLPGLMKQFGEMLRKFAFSSISHGDFKATNFILSDEGLLFIADLDAVRKHWSKLKFKKSFREDLLRLMQNWKNTPHIEALFRDEISKIYETIN